MQRIAITVLLLSLLLLSACSSTQKPAAAPSGAAGGAQAAAPAAKTKEAWNDLAYQHLQAKNWTEAIKAAEEAVKLDGQYPQARFNLGLAYYRAERFAEAQPHLQIAYDLNKAQVEPGWFLALTLEKLGDLPKATALMKELAGRFPADKEVAEALTRLSSSGPVVWQYSLDAPSLFMGDRLIRHALQGQGVQAVGPDGKPFWTTPIGADVGSFLHDGTGNRILVTSRDTAHLLNPVTGKLLGKVTLPPLIGGLNDKTPWHWQGDWLYAGQDVWSGSRYSHTAWRAYKLTQQGDTIKATPVFEGIMGVQGLSLSSDGRTAFIPSPVPSTGTVYVEGKKLADLKSAANGRFHVNPAGDAIYLVSYDGEIIRYRPTGEEVWRRKAPSGYTQLTPWSDGADFLWIASRSEEGFVVLRGKSDQSVPMSGKVVASTPRYLLVNEGQEVLVYNDLLNVKGRLPVTRGQLSTDGKWLTTSRQMELKAYRLP